MKNIYITILLVITVLHVVVINAQQNLNGRIVYTVNTEQGSSIRMFDFSNNMEVVLTDGINFDYEPVLSPNGERIAFTSYRNGNNSIYTLNVDGTGLSQVTNSNLDEINPTWSPSGNRIAYTSSSGFRSVPNIYVINADGTNNIQLTTNGGSNPDWSPTGNSIAFMSYQNGGINHLHVINVDGTGLNQITNGNGEYDPQWSPNGNKIAFRGADETVYIIDIDTLSSPQPVTNESDVGTFDWLNSNTIVYTTPSLGGYFSLILRDIDGTIVEEIDSPYLQNITAINLASLAEPILNCDDTISLAGITTFVNSVTTANNTGSPYTICLENGTYTFTASDNSDTYGANALPVITGDITIIGNGATIERDINAVDFRFFRVESGGTLTLDNLTLQNGVTSGTGWSGDGGAIHNRGTLNLVDTTLINNTANVEGGGIFNDTNATVSITNSVISNNTAIADDGGAIDNHGNLVIIGSTFEYNSSTNNDGGAFWNDSNATIDISDSIIRYNTANTDGGAIRNFGTVNITNTIVDNNTALTDDGGAISSDTGVLTVTNGSLNNNQAMGDDGGAIATYGSLTLSNVTIDGNTSSNDGGAVYADSINVSVDNQSTFSNNSAGQDGGALYIRGSTSTSTLIDSTFLTNTAPRNGGAIYFDHGSNAISNTLFQANSASNHGGAIFFDDGSVNITANTIFDNNQSTQDGGAIFTNENFTISDSIFRFNSAGDQGGAVRAERSSASFIVNSCIHDNTASNTSGFYMTVSNFDATYNWWGASDGPGGSGTGSGDEVNNNVNYANFVTTSCVDASGANGISSQLLALTPNSSNTPANAGDPNNYPVVVLPYEDNFDTVDDWFGTVRWEQDNSAGRTGGAWLIDTSIRGQVNTLEMTTWIELTNNPQIRLDYAEQAQLSSGDIVTLEIQIQGNSDWTVLSQSVSGSYTWRDRSISLADYRGQTIRLRWRVEVSTDIPLGEASTQYVIDDFAITRR